MSETIPHSKYLADVGAASLSQAIAALSDVALFVNFDEVIEEVSGNPATLSQLGASVWCGRRLDEVVDAGLAELRGIFSGDACDDGIQSCQVTHRTKDGTSATIGYSALPGSDNSGVLLLGRSLQFLPASQTGLLPDDGGTVAFRPGMLAADYRALFQAAPTAGVIVEAGSGRVLDLNPAAADLLGVLPGSARGERFQDMFARRDRAIVSERLAETSRTALSVSFPASSNHDRQMMLNVSRPGARTLLVQLAETDGATEDLRQTLLSLLHSAGEAVVLTDARGMIIWANDAFVSLSEAGAPAALTGVPLGDFFDKTEMDIEVALASVQHRGPVQMLQAKLQGSIGRVANAELSISSLHKGSAPCFGVIIRDLSLRARSGGEASLDLSHADPSIDPGPGDHPLRQRLRQHTDALEKSSIEAALTLTGNNRTAAAKVLGLSRQTLYSKIRKHEIDSTS